MWTLPDYAVSINTHEFLSDVAVGARSPPPRTSEPSPPPSVYRNRRATILGAAAGAREDHHCGVNDEVEELQRARTRGSYRSDRVKSEAAVRDLDHLTDIGRMLGAGFYMCHGGRPGHAYEGWIVA